MSYPRLAARLWNAPLLISAAKLDVLDHVLRAHQEGRAKLLSPYEKKERAELSMGGAVRTQSGYVRTGDGVALIPIMGTLMQRTGPMDAESGLTSYAEIGAQIRAAMSDHLTRGILLEIDSDGGEVNGIFGLADEMRSASTIKPIFAHVNEQAFSGGYLLAATAEQIYTPRTGMVGSIGVRMRHVDQSQKDAKQGMVYTDIVAGDRKADMNPHEPLSDPARQWMQDHVERIYEMFVSHVSGSRGIEDQVVRDTQAGLIHADEAVTLGLVDGVATIDDTMYALLDRIEFARIHGMRAAARASIPASQTQSDKGAATMPDPKEATYTAAQLAEAESRAAAKAKADAESAALEASNAAATKAAADAQTRIAAILDHEEAKGRETLARHLAFKTTNSVDDAVAMLKAAPKDGGRTTNLLAERMKGTNPNVSADNGGGDETEADVVARIMGAGKRPQLAAVK